MALAIVAGTTTASSADTTSSSPPPRCRRPRPDSPTPGVNVNNRSWPPPRRSDRARVSSRCREYQQQVSALDPDALAQPCTTSPSSTPSGPRSRRSCRRWRPSSRPMDVLGDRLRRRRGGPAPSGRPAPDDRLVLTAFRTLAAAPGRLPARRPGPPCRQPDPGRGPTRLHVVSRGPSRSGRVRPADRHRRGRPPSTTPS